MNGCEGKTQCAGQESASAKAKVPGIGNLPGILGALGCVTESDTPVNTLDIEDFVNEFDCKFVSMPDNLDYFVMTMEDFEKFWGAASSVTRSDIISKHAKPKVPAYTEQEALHTAFSEARKSKMASFIAQHGNKVFNTYDAWQNLGFQVRQGGKGQKAVAGIDTVVIFGIGQTVATIDSLTVGHISGVIRVFCNANGIYGWDKIISAYPWANKYFDGAANHMRFSIRETGEII